MDGSHVERMPQDEDNALLTAEIGDPMSGENALCGHRQVFLVRLDHRQERASTG
ncbi:MAG: hypothetical protein ACREYE_02250 [Gammaproteobacteria bacterium]